MKKAIALFAATCCAAALAQSHYVRPYVRSDGTYVQGHHQTAPDNSRLNNWSTQGNVNPYTGQQGTVNPYQQPLQPQYQPQPQWPPADPFGRPQTRPQGRAF